MEITITPQTLVTVGGWVTAALLLIKRFANGVRWFDKQEKQSTDIEALRQLHNTDMQSMEDKLDAKRQTINDEKTLLTYGILACLKGLKEQGCNGPVTEAIGKIEKHLNIQAHKV